MRGNFSFSDAELREAVRQVRDAKLAALPAPEDCPEVETSPGFDDRIKALAAQFFARKRHRARLQHVAAAVLALVLGTGVWLSVDSQARAAVVNWFREVRENSVIYRFFTDKDEFDMAFPHYRLEGLDPGYTLVSEDDHPTSYGVYYENENTGKGIAFEYSIAYDQSYLNVVPEGDNFIHEKVTIGSVEGDYYQDTAPDSSNVLIWFDETRRIVFTLNCNLDKEEILSLAEKIYCS